MSSPFSIQDRSFEFSVRIVNLHKFLINQPQFPYSLANQLLRSGTSVGANIAEAQAAQSKKDFIPKMCISAKEARETQYWLKRLVAAELVKDTQLSEIQDEINQIIAILTSIIITSQKGVK